MNNDIDNLLNQLGIASQIDNPEPQPVDESQYVEFEEVPEGSEASGEVEEEVTNGNYDENTGEGRGLDTEENAEMTPTVSQLTTLLDEISSTPNPDEVSTNEQETVQPHLMDLADAIINSTPATVTSDSSEVSTTQEPLIQPNSPTFSMDETTSRFSGTEWYNEIRKKRITVAGIGGIGSNVVFQLARMCPEALFMYDSDSVEAVNMSGQLYSRADIGMTKVDAMFDMITKYTNMHDIYSYSENYSIDSSPTDIMICGFDNMSARKVFYDSWCFHVAGKPEEERKNCLFIDGRLSIDTLQVFCIQGNDPQNMLLYDKKYLFKDSEADETICSLKQTTYLACMIGSVMVNLFTNWVANSIDPIIPYDVPFFTEYDAQNMIFKTLRE